MYHKKTGTHIGSSFLNINQKLCVIIIIIDVTSKHSSMTHYSTCKDTYMYMYIMYMYVPAHPCMGPYAIIIYTCSKLDYYTNEDENQNFIIFLFSTHTHTHAHTHTHTHTHIHTHIHTHRIHIGYIAVQGYICIYTYLLCCHGNDRFISPYQNST